MIKKEKILFAIVLALITIALISFSGAIVYQGDPFFELSQESFGPGQTLEGILNFSLYEESGNTIVSSSISSVKKEMKLIDFLNEANAVFNCEPDDCSIVYEASNAGPKKTVDLVAGQEKYFALKISGKSDVEILNLSFLMSGYSEEDMTCGESPLQLDILDDGIIDWEFKESDDWCTNTYGAKCLGQATENSVVDSVSLCEKIKMNKTGQVKLYAYLKLNSGTADFEISIYDGSEKKGSCILTPYEYEYKMYDCMINLYEYPDFYISEEKDYFVCIKKDSGDGQVFIKSESEGSVCGFYGEPPKDVYTIDYALYVQLAGFVPFNETVVFDETVFLGNDLKAYIQNYIVSKYNKNCVDGCVLPMKFISKSEQQLNLTDLNFEFTSTTGKQVLENFYSVSVNWPKIDMGAQGMDFSVLNISAPQQPGTYSVVARVGVKSRSQSFIVESVPIIQSVSPTIVIPGKATEFGVLASAPAGRQIVEYIWDFGDNTGEMTTSEPKITHTYSEIKTYTLTIKAKDNLDLIGSRSFSVTSNITKELLNITIHNLRARLDSFTYQYEALDYWYQDLISINVSDVDEKLDEFESEIETATQSTLIDIKTELDLLNIPLSINDTTTLLDSPYITNLEKIIPNHIAIITQQSYSSDLKSQYQNAIALWQEDNINLRINGQVKSLVYDDRIEDVLTLVNIRLDPYNSGQAYFIFHLPSGINYNSIRTSSNANEKSDLEDAIAFVFYDLSSSEIISIALPGKHDFSSFVFYVSPSFSELQVEGGIIPGTGKKTPYFLAIILFLILILGVSIALWLIWRGKGKGRKKLFSNSADLYNLISVISSSQAGGLSKQQIVEQLQRSGWTKKQIDYAFKKMKKQPAMSRGMGRPTRPTRPSSLRGFRYRR